MSLCEDNIIKYLILIFLYERVTNSLILSFHCMFVTVKCGRSSNKLIFHKENTSEHNHHQAVVVYYRYVNKTEAVFGLCL